MNLPKAIANMKEEKKPKLEPVVDQPVSEALKQQLDVEYDDYPEDLFNGFTAMSQQHPPKRDENETLVVRDFSIDTWNGSPGLTYFGYDADRPEK